MKRILYLLLFISFSANAQSYLAKSVNGNNADINGNITTPDAQTLSTTYSSDSIALSISGGNTIKFAYAVDSVGLNGSSDSIIVYKYGIRKPYKNGSSGSGAALSAITAATGSATINSSANAIEWQWNSLTSGIGLKLSSSSTSASSNTQTLFSLSQSGANATSTQSTYVQKISNTKTGTTSTNYGLDIACSGGSNNYAINIQSGYLKLNNNQISFGASSNMAETGGVLTANVAGISINTSSGVGQMIGINSGGLTHFSAGWVNSYSQPYMTLGGYRESSLQWRSYLQYPIIFQNINGDVSLSQDNGLTYGNVFTPTERVRFKVDGSIGVGIASPNASALMDLTSTTRGLLIPRGTRIQITSISTPATGLMMYNNVQNQIAFYNGVNWIGGLDTTNAPTKTLTYGTDFVFYGTTATWTLPAIVSTIAGRQNSITIKNRGSGNVTINTNGGSNVLYDTSLVNTITLTPGQYAVFMPDGQYFNRE